MSDDNGQIDESIYDEIRQATAETYGTQIAKPVTYRIGRQISVGVWEIFVTDPEIPGSVWVHDIDDETGSRAVIAINTDIDPARLSKRAFVETEVIGKKIRLKRMAIQNAIYSGGVPVRPQRPIDATQLNIGLMYPKNPPGMSCLISDAMRTLDNETYLQPVLSTKDFTADIPVSNSISVKIELNPVDNVLYYLNGGSFSSALSLKSAYVGGDLSTSVTVGRFLIGWVKLFFGQTTITRDEILSAGEFLEKSTGTGNTFDPNTIVTFEGQIVTYQGNVVTYEAP